MGQKPKNNVSIAIAFAVFAVPASALLIWAELGGSVDFATGTESSCGDKFSARAAAEVLVSKQLKAPSTAKFPGMFDEEPRVTPLGQCQYRVASYVDAQNSFGAMLRMNYQIDMAYSLSTEKWTLIDLQMQ